MDIARISCIDGTSLLCHLRETRVKYVTQVLSDMKQHILIHGKRGQYLLFVETEITLYVQKRKHFKLSVVALSGVLLWKMSVISIQAPDMVNDSCLIWKLQVWRACRRPLTLFCPILKFEEKIHSHTKGLETMNKRKILSTNFILEDKECMQCLRENVSYESSSKRASHWWKCLDSVACL